MKVDISKALKRKIAKIQTRLYEKKSSKNMIVKPIKTEIITQESGSLLQILEKYLPKIKEGSVLAITSKIVAICEGNVVDFVTNKEELIRKEAEWFLPPSSSKYNVCLAIKDHVLAASAGIDESNSKDGYVLLPKNSQQTANLVRSFFIKKFQLQNFGVIITDSRTTPLQWGVTGFSLAYSGFEPLNDYIGTPDLFNRPFHFSKTSVINGLAAAAVLTMGEGKESQPLALIEDLPFVKFQNQDPTPLELTNLIIEPADDLYAPLLTSVKWQKGGKTNKS